MGAFMDTIISCCNKRKQGVNLTLLVDWYNNRWHNRNLEEEQGNCCRKSNHAGYLGTGCWRISKCHGRCSVWGVCNFMFRRIACQAIVRRVPSFSPVLSSNLFERMFSKHVRVGSNRNATPELKYANLLCTTRSWCWRHSHPTKLYSTSSRFHRIG